MLKQLSFTYTCKYSSIGIVQVANAEEIVDKNVKGAENGAAPNGVQKGVPVGGGCCGPETGDVDGCGQWVARRRQGVGSKL